MVHKLNNDESDELTKIRGTIFERIMNFGTGSRYPVTATNQLYVNCVVLAPKRLIIVCAKMSCFASTPASIGSSACAIGKKLHMNIHEVNRRTTNGEQYVREDAK